MWMNYNIECLPKRIWVEIVYHQLSCVSTWRLACAPVVNLPTALENGWVIENGKICTELMLSSSVPDAIIELKKGCKINSCSFKRANLVCTDSCFCNDHEKCDNTSYCKGSEIDHEDKTNVVFCTHLTSLINMYIYIYIYIF